VHTVKSNIGFVAVDMPAGIRLGALIHFYDLNIQIIQFYLKM